VGQSSLKIAILGTGVFGRYHVQKAALHASIQQINLYDPDAARMQAVATEFGAQVHPSAQAAIQASDAVIIAAPASEHTALAIAALEMGRHCLVEKPLARTVKSGQRICDLVHDKGLIVHVGHQERYVLSAIGLDTIISKPRLIEMYRENPFNLRGTDVSATLDLTVHDLDMVMWLMKEEPLGVMASGDRVKTDHIDRSRAELLFGTTKAVIHTSRVAADAKRFMRLTYPEGVVEIDFNKKTLLNRSPFMLNEDFAKDPRAKDALGASDHAFIDAVIAATPSSISVEDGLRALRWALEIDKLISV